MVIPGIWQEGTPAVSSTFAIDTIGLCFQPYALALQTEGLAKGSACMDGTFELPHVSAHLL